MFLRILFRNIWDLVWRYFPPERIVFASTWCLMAPLIQNQFKLNFWIGLFTLHRQWPSVSKLWPSCVHRLSKEFFPYKIYLQTNRLFSLITLSWSISSFGSQTYMSCPCMAQWNWDSSHQELVDTPEVTNFFTLAYPLRFVISSHFPSLRSF